MAESVILNREEGANFIVIGLDGVRHLALGWKECGEYAVDPR